MMNLCKQIPFIKINYKKVINYIKQKSIMKYEGLENFVTYFEQTWINFFKDETLKLDDTNIKFRTNNILERFNRTLKKYFGKKKNISLKNYIDILIEEVNSHEEYLIKENKKPYKLIANNYLKGNIPLENNNNNIEFNEKVYSETIPPRAGEPSIFIVETHDVLFVFTGRPDTAGVEKPFPVNVTPLKTNEIGIPFSLHCEIGFSPRVSNDTRGEFRLN